jgi:hypothetical protein
MSRDEAIARNVIIDDQMKALDVVWESALSARDEAQKTLDAIGEMRRKAQARQIENLRAVTE